MPAKAASDAPRVKNVVTRYASSAYGPVMARPTKGGNEPTRIPAANDRPSPFTVPGPAVCPRLRYDAALARAASPSTTTAATSHVGLPIGCDQRSEERRVGKECR